VTQVWKAINHYEALLADKPCILAGDFNSNSIWDHEKKRKLSNHGAVVRFLAERGIHSTYHLWHDQQHGREKHPTQYMYRHKDKAYHLDYCFASSYFIDKLQHIEIGKHRSWLLHSDHMPVFVDFKI
jgi:exodeoxyribonuclease III